MSRGPGSALRPSSQHMQWPRRGGPAFSARARRVCHNCCIWKLNVTMTFKTCYPYLSIPQSDDKQEEEEEEEEKMNAEHREIHRYRKYMHSMISISLWLICMKILCHHGIPKWGQGKRKLRCRRRRLWWKRATSMWKRRFKTCFFHVSATILPWFPCECRPFALRILSSAEPSPLSEVCTMSLSRGLPRHETTLRWGERCLFLKIRSSLRCAAMAGPNDCQEQGPVAPVATALQKSCCGVATTQVKSFEDYQKMLASICAQRDLRFPEPGIYIYIYMYIYIYIYIYIVQNVAKKIKKCRDSVAKCSGGSE